MVRPTPYITSKTYRLSPKHPTNQTEQAALPVLDAELFSPNPKHPTSITRMRNALFRINHSFAQMI
jgi:hypothetical protein